MNVELYKQENKRFKVLLLNGDKFYELIMEALLGDQFEFFFAKNNNEITKLMEILPIDMIIINEKRHFDNQVKLEILKKIKLEKRHSHIKLFALTGSDKNEHDFVKKGYDGVFKKSLNEQTIYDAFYN